MPTPNYRIGYITQSPDFRTSLKFKISRVRAALETADMAPLKPNKAKKVKSEVALTPADSPLDIQGEA